MIGVSIEGISGLQDELKKHSKKFGSNVIVEVSFSTEYGVYVHEDLEAAHNVGEAKFLENAAIQNQQEVGDYVSKLAPQTNLGLALYGGGTIIQRAAQKKTPVDTGALKASARTEMAIA